MLLEGVTILLLLFLRKRLFNMINDLPTVYEALVDRKHVRDRSGVDSSGKSKHSTKVSISLPQNSETSNAVTSDFVT
jgi:hypothetical protein